MITIGGQKFRIFESQVGVARIKQYFETDPNMFFPCFGKTKNWYWVTVEGSQRVAEFSSVELAKTWLQQQYPKWVEINYNQED